MGTPADPHRGHPAAPNVIGPHDGMPFRYGFTGNGYGAIAFSASTRRYGYSYGAADRSAAERIALAHCHGSDATILAWGQRTFLALALADDGAYGWAWDSGRNDAAGRAIAGCAGPNPRIVLLFHTSQG